MGKKSTQASFGDVMFLANFVQKAMLDNSDVPGQNGPGTESFRIFQENQMLHGSKKEKSSAAHVCPTVLSRLHIGLRCLISRIPSNSLRWRAPVLSIE